MRIEFERETIHAENKIFNPSFGKKPVIISHILDTKYLVFNGTEVSRGIII
jgi:hypothetical protein